MTDMRRTLILALFLVAYGNAASLILESSTPAGWWPGVPIGMLLLVVALIWGTRIFHLGTGELGLAPGHLQRSALVGILAAVVAAIPALIFLRFPPLIGHPVEYAPLGSLPRDALLWRTFLWMPLDTVIPEELAFRGVLLGWLRRRYSKSLAVVVSAAAFGCWHVVIVSRTIASTNLQSAPVLAIVGVFGAMLAVFAGGLLFAWIRVRTGHLAGSIVAHWGFNAVLLLGLGGIA